MRPRRSVALVGIGFAVLAVVSLQARADRVKVTVATIEHPMDIAPLAENSMYPVRVSGDKLKPISAAIKARRDEIESDLRQTDAAAFKAASEAKAAFDALSAEDRRSEKGQSLLAPWHAWQARVTAAADGDDRLHDLLAELTAARQSVYRQVTVEVPVVTLNNGLLEVKVVPTFGMRVLNAVDLRSNTSLAGTPEPRHYEEEPFAGNLAWTAGYVEPSFPYFEHGVGTDQSAGYRVIHHDDGAVTVAMNMRFTQYQDTRHMDRYGRFSQRILSGWATLRPGDTRYSLTYRLDNPNPLRRSDRLWVNVLMDAERYDEEHILYPVGWVAPHGAGSIHPFYFEGGQRSWRNVSHFGIGSDYTFCGVYRPATDSNALVLTEPDSPGMKLYTTNRPGGFLELWTGHGYVFEDPGNFVQGFEPVQFTLHFTAVTGVGRVAFANRDVAVAEKDGSFSVVFPTAGKYTITYPGGSRAVDAEPGRGVSLGKLKDGAWTIRRGEAELAAFSLPLVHSDRRPMLDDIRDLGGKYRIELEENTNHRGAPTGRDAIPAAKKLVEADRIEDADHAMSLANTCYRYGHLDLAVRVCSLVGDRPDADLLRGLIAWERSEPVDFGKAGVDANYHRALLAVQQGDAAAAVKQLDALIEARPTVYRPRLLRAYLKKDLDAARELATVNPASPEAQLVLEMLGDAKAGVQKDELLRNNPDAEAHVEAFRMELTRGHWQPMKRFEPFTPKPVAPNEP